MAKTDFEFSDVLISPREPYDKKTIWIYPTENNIEIKLFYNGSWKIISQTKDEGLSEKSKIQIENINKELRQILMNILKKYFGKFSSDYNIIRERQNTLEEQMKNLEDKFDKLNKKYSIIKYGGK